MVTETTAQPAAPDPAERAAAREIERRKRLLKLYALLLLVPLGVIAAILIAGRSERVAMKDDVRAEVAAQTQGLGANLTSQVRSAAAELRDISGEQREATRRAESRIAALERQLAAPRPPLEPVPAFPPAVLRELDRLRDAVSSLDGRIGALSAEQRALDSAQSSLQGGVAALRAELEQQRATIRRIEERLDRLDKRLPSGTALEPADLAALQRRLAELEAKVVVFEGGTGRNR